MSAFNIRWYAVDQSIDGLVRDVCVDAGSEDPARMAGPDDISWGGGYVLLVSDGVETFEETILDHPETKFLLVGSPVYWTAHNLIQLTDLMEARNKIQSLIEAHQDERPTGADTPEKRAKKARRLARRFVGCVYCGKPISVIGFSIKSHETKCRRDFTKKPARGRLLTAYQICGKSKGSILVLEIPEDLVTKNYQLSAGTHIIADRRLIRKINATLNEHFNYTLESSDE